MKNRILIRNLVEAAIMIAISTVLSTLKIVDMPVGGSVTFASMVPVMLIAYRHGFKWGMGTALTYSLLQLLLGLENYGYVSGWLSYVILTLFDYVIAFVVIGLGCMFKDRFKSEHISKNASQATELALAAFIISVLRYICHVISGATIWATLPVGSAAAIAYSFGYNAVFMIPETIINTLVAFYIGYFINLTAKTPRPFVPSETSKKLGTASLVLRASAVLSLFAVVVADACMIFAHTQDPESAAFTFQYMNEVNWLAFIIVTAVGLALSAALFVTDYIMEKRAADETEEA